jgi:hypothetical protein
MGKRMKAIRRLARLAWPTLKPDAARIAGALGRGERRLGREEFDPSVAERERCLGRKLPDRSPDRRN